MKYLYPISLLFLLCFAGCASVPELLNQGKFEEAYAKARKHCTRGRAPNLKKINQFLDAYAAVQASDHQRAKDVAARSGSQKWAELYEIYDDLHGRSIDLLKIAPRAIDLKKYPHLLTECEQTAGMTAYGEVRVYQWGSERMEWSAEIQSWTSWSNEYRVGSGDSRALPAFANSGMASFPPSPQSMLVEALDYLPVRAITALTKRYAPKVPEQRKEKTDR